MASLDSQEHSEQFHTDFVEIHYTGRAQSHVKLGK
jgi:hypothetical protein